MKSSQQKSSFRRLKHTKYHFDDIENKFKTQKQKSFEDFFEKNNKNDSEKKLFAKLDDAISDVELKKKKLSAFDDFDILIVQAERKSRSRA